MTDWCFIDPNPGASHELEMEVAIAWLAAAGRACGQAVILMPTLGGLSGGALESVLGRERTARLKRKLSVPIDGVEARVVSARTVEQLASVDRAAPVLCLYCSESELQAVDDCGFDSACAMPLDDRTTEWCDRVDAQQLSWNPQG